MNQRKHLTLVAAAAALLAAMPLATVFEKWTWLVDAVLVVAALCGTAVLVRSLRVPPWAPTAAMVGSLLIVLTWLFPGDSSFAGIIPTPGTFQHFNDLLVTAGTDMNRFAAPVDDAPSLLFLATLGVGAVTIVIDLLAVVLRKPALTGLPMLAIYSVPVAVEADSVSLVPFVLGAAGFLWLLVTDNVDRIRRFGRRFTGDGRDVDLWEPSPLAAAGQRLALIGISVAVILPLAVPGMTTGLLDRFGTGGTPGAAGNGRGSSGAVSLFAVMESELNRDRTTEMLKVSTTDPTPYYLRIAVADELTPAGFQGRPLRGGIPAGDTVPLPELGTGVTTRSYVANVEILQFEMGYLPVYSHATKIASFRNGDLNQWRYHQETATFFAGRANTKGKSYRFEFADPEISKDALKRSEPLPPGDRIQTAFTKRPSPTPKEVRDVLNQVTAGLTAPYDKVIAILNFFSTNNRFEYDTKTGFNTDGPKIVEFLTNRRGFCVQYAAAMAWLVREAGIPARVAFGFTRGGTADKQGMVTLTNFNLHAWTEVYFKGFGWVPFDATPASRIAGSVSPDWAPNPSRPLEPEPSETLDTQPGTAGDPSGPAPDPRLGEDGGNIGSGNDPSADQGVPMWAYLAAAALVLMLFVPAVHRSSLRRRRLRARAAPALAGVGSGDAVVVAAEDHARLAARFGAHQAWDELIDTMVDYRVPVDEAETPRMTTDRLIHEQELTERAAGGATLLGRAEERARYSRTPLTSGELSEALARVRQAVRQRAGRRATLMAILMPPSVTRRWRAVTVRWFTDTVNAVAKRRDALVRTLSVRRLLTRTR